MNAASCWTLPALSLLVSIEAGGCAYRYEVGSGAPGALTVDAPGALPPPLLASAGSGPGNASGPPVSGMYGGEAVALNDPGGVCSTRMRITNWVVTESRVSFGSFNGTIRPDGTLLMQAGPRYIRGRFTGSRFSGQFWQPPPSCEYGITVEPVR